MNDQIDEIYQEIDKLERKQKEHNSRISVIRNNLSDIKMNISNTSKLATRPLLRGATSITFILSTGSRMSRPTTRGL